MTTKTSSSLKRIMRLGAVAIIPSLFSVWKQSQLLRGLNIDKLEEAVIAAETILQPVEDITITAWVSRKSQMNTTYVVREYQVPKMSAVYQRVKVNIRLCTRDKGKTTGASTLPSCPNQNCEQGQIFDDLTGECRDKESGDDESEASQDLQDDYEVFFTIFQDTTRVRRRQPPRQSDIVLTSWNPEQKQHILLPDSYQKYCDSQSESRFCPKYCAESQSEDMMYVWDSLDGHCKPFFHNQWERNAATVCGCIGTCFTPSAYEINTTYPWSSESQRLAFQGENYSKPRTKEFLTWRTKRKKDSLRPKFKKGNSFCAPVIRSQNQSTAFPPLEMVDPLIAAAYDYVYFIPEAKLIFCGIPKVGITEWLKFLRFTRGATDYQSMPHYKYDRLVFRLAALPREKAAEILMDPTWTRAVMFRDPAERLLSAYLDKIVKHGYSQRIFGSSHVLNFTEFVDLVTHRKKRTSDRRGLHHGTDPHWAPQTTTCGLDYLLPAFDFLGSFDYVSEHTRMLLERVGVWDTWGKNFDNRDPEGHSLCMGKPPSQNGTKPDGFNQRPPSNTLYRHGNSATSKMDHYYTPELLKKVKKAYAMDYVVWEEIRKRDVNDVIAGYELPHVKKACL